MESNNKIKNNKKEEIEIVGFISMKYSIKHTEWGGIWRVWSYLEKEEFNKIYNELKEKYGCKSFKIMVYTSNEEIRDTIYIFVKNRYVIKLQYVPAKIKPDFNYDMEISGIATPIIHSRLIEKLPEIFNNKEDAEIFLLGLEYANLFPDTKEKVKEKIMKLLETSKIIKKVRFI